MRKFLKVIYPLMLIVGIGSTVYAGNYEERDHLREVAREFFTTRDIYQAFQYIQGGAGFKYNGIDKGDLKENLSEREYYKRSSIKIDMEKPGIVLEGKTAIAIFESYHVDTKNNKAQRFKNKVFFNKFSGKWMVYWFSQYEVNKKTNNEWN